MLVIQSFQTIILKADFTKKINNCVSPNRIYMRPWNNNSIITSKNQNTITSRKHAMRLIGHYVSLLRPVVYSIVGQWVNGRIAGPLIEPHDFVSIEKL